MRMRSALWRLLACTCWLDAWTVQTQSRCLPFVLVPGKGIMFFHTELLLLLFHTELLCGVSCCLLWWVAACWCA